MNNKKAVSVILSMILVSGVILISLLVSYRWSIPIFETNKQLMELKNVESKFSEINSKINRVSIEGDLSSRQVKLNINSGRFYLEKNNDLVKYIVLINDRLCDEVSSLVVSADRNTSIPSGITSVSGIIYKGNYSFDGVVKQFVLSDPISSRVYDHFYVVSEDEDECFEEYKKGDIFLTDNKLSAFEFMEANVIGEAAEIEFKQLSKKEENFYSFCGSGRETTEFTLLLKYKNPSLLGNNCELVNHFNEINLTGSSYCVSSCSLKIQNDNGNVKISQE